LHISADFQLGSCPSLHQSARSLNADRAFRDWHLDIGCAQIGEVRQEGQEPQAEIGRNVQINFSSVLDNVKTITSKQ